MVTESPLEQQRKVVFDLRERTAREELILEGMERMAAFTRGESAPKAPPVNDPPPKRMPARGNSGGSKGRQLGAISKRWRDVFSKLVHDGNRFNDDEVIQTVFKLEQRVMRRSEVRRLFENHQKNDLVAFNDDETYSVTQHAIDKFDLGRNEEGPTDKSEGPSFGGVAERFIASDSKSDGDPLHSAPVGSNPTASAPSIRPLGNLIYPAGSTSTTNWPSEA